MREPRRLIDEARGEDGGGLAHALLGAARAESLAPRDKQAIWTGLAAQALVTTPVAASVAPAAGVVTGGKALGIAAVVKGTLVIVALAGGGVVGARALRRSAPPVEPAGNEASAPAQAPLAPPSPASAPVGPPALVAPPPAVRQSAPRPTPASRLAEEGRVVLEARRALRAGDAAMALRRLEGARAAFAGGALAQEREALAIEALAQLGRRDDAAARARAFLRTYPGSPHAAAVVKLAAP